MKLTYQIDIGFVADYTELARELGVVRDVALGIDENVYNELICALNDDVKHQKAVELITATQTAAIVGNEIDGLLTFEFKGHQLQLILCPEFYRKTTLGIIKILFKKSKTPGWIIQFRPPYVDAA